ncbi:MAG TPA: hypothetical protein VGC44_10950 [Longimicrobiales bacterium]
MPGRKLEWKWIFDAVTMLTVVLGVTFGAAELRELRESQESQAMMQLYQTLQSPDHVRGTNYIGQLPATLSADSILALSITGPYAAEMRQVTLTFEAIGVMVYRGDVPIEWVDELFHYSIVSSWNKLKPSVMLRRQRLNYPAVLEWYQWLAERLMERENRQDAMPAYEAYRDWKPPRD